MPDLLDDVLGPWVIVAVVAAVGAADAHLGLLAAVVGVTLLARG